MCKHGLSFFRFGVRISCSGEGSQYSVYLIIGCTDGCPPLEVVDSLLDPAAVMESFQPCEHPVHLQAWTIALQFHQVCSQLRDSFCIV